MEKFISELSLPPMKRRVSSLNMQGKHIVQDDALWRELQQELLNSRVITSLGVKEVTQTFIANNADRLEQAVQTEKRQLLLDNSTQLPQQKSSFCWGNVLNGDRHRQPSDGGSFTMTRSSISSGVAEKLYEILQAVAFLDEDLETETLSSSLSSNTQRVAAGFASQEDSNVFRDHQPQELLSHTKTYVDEDAICKGLKAKYCVDGGEEESAHGSRYHDDLLVAFPKQDRGPTFHIAKTA